MRAKYVRITDEKAGEMLEKIAEEDFRTQGVTVALLVRKEFESRKEAKKRHEFPAVTSYPPVLIPLDPQAGEAIANPSQSS